MTDSVFTSVQVQFVEYLRSWWKDLGGKRNFHNGKGRTYDCIMIFSYYTVLRDVVTFSEIETLYKELFLPSFKTLVFVDANRKVYRRLLHFAFSKAARKCSRWHEYKMIVEPYRDGEPVRYRFMSCPVAEFAREHDLLHILPALCNIDYYAIAVMHARLVRTTTLSKATAVTMQLWETEIHISRSILNIGMRTADYGTSGSILCLTLFLYRR